MQGVWLMRIMWLMGVSGVILEDVTQFSNHTGAGSGLKQRTLKRWETFH